MRAREEGQVLAKRERAQEAPPISDPYGTLPVFVGGLAAAYVSDAHISLTFFVEQQSLVTGALERIVNLRVIMRLESIPGARDLVNDAIGDAEVRRVMDS